jgi:hypothetical protein
VHSPRHDLPEDNKHQENNRFRRKS